MAASGIEVEVEVGAPAEVVWEIVSDIDSEPEFWKGTKSVRNISRDGNFVRREITIAFRDQKCMQDVTLHPQKWVVEARFTDGIIKGKKTLRVTPSDGGQATSTLRTTWDVKMTGMMGMFTGMLKGHIRNGTEMAMQSIKAAAEERHARP